jgi:hypothetical protein
VRDREQAPRRRSLRRCAGPRCCGRRWHAAQWPPPAQGLRCCDRSPGCLLAVCPAASGRAAEWPGRRDDVHRRRESRPRAYQTKKQRGTAALRTAARHGRPETRGQLPRQPLLEGEVAGRMLVIFSVFITGLDASGRPAAHAKRATPNEPFPAQAKLNAHAPAAQGCVPEATEETDGRPCSTANAGRAHARAGWTRPRRIRLPGAIAAISRTRVYIHPAAFQLRSERCQRVHVQRGDSRECDAHVMSGCAVPCQTSHPSGRCEPSNCRRWPAASTVNLLEKRADCTTTLLLDVDAVQADRARATCGVSDVLAALSPKSLAGSVTLCCSSSQQPPAVARNCAPTSIVVSRPRNSMIPVPWARVVQ